MQSLKKILKYIILIITIVILSNYIYLFFLNINNNFTESLQYNYKYIFITKQFGSGDFGTRYDFIPSNNSCRKINLEIEFNSQELGRYGWSGFESTTSKMNAYNLFTLAVIQYHDYKFDTINEITEVTLKTLVENFEKACNIKLSKFDIYGDPTSLRTYPWVLPSDIILQLGMVLISTLSIDQLIFPFFPKERQFLRKLLILIAIIFIVIGCYNYTLIISQYQK